MNVYHIINTYYPQGTVFGVIVLRCPDGTQRKWMGWDTLIDDLCEKYKVKYLDGLDITELPDNGGFIDNDEF